MSDDKHLATLPPPAYADWEHVLPTQWRQFVRFCRDLKYGEIERLSIQDGVPVLAEVTTKKVKF